MLTWFNNPELTWAQQLCVNILKTGHMPKHAAFMLDGNRRYAKKTNISVLEGNTKGSEKLVQMFHWCKVLGINEVTVYLFSINNFKRSKKEVSETMELITKELEWLFEEKDKIIRYGMCIRFIGNFSYLSPKQRKLISQLMILSQNNTKCILNVAISYSSQEEITNSAQCILEAVDAGLLEVDDIDEQLISNCLYTNKSPDPDILVRTSGEIRFSNFLLWQISCTQVFFSKTFWPEYSIWNLLAAVFKYQADYNYMLSVKKTKAALYNKCTQNNPRVAKFLDNLKTCRRQQLESYVNLL